MSKVIWKFEFAVEGFVTVEMPLGAEIVKVGSQKKGHICLWAIVDAGSEHAHHHFAICGTGHSLPYDDERAAELYVGTAFDGPFVWHVFKTP